jgi:hypothetical protein
MFKAKKKKQILTYLIGYQALHHHRIKFTSMQASLHALPAKPLEHSASIFQAALFNIIISSVPG